MFFRGRQQIPAYVLVYVIPVGVSEILYPIVDEEPLLCVTFSYLFLRLPNLLKAFSFTFAAPCTGP